MALEAKPLTELAGRDTTNVAWNIQLPDFAQPDRILINHGLMTQLAGLLGSAALRIVSEEAAVSRRLYSAALSDNDWSPNISNIGSARRDVPSFRTVANDTRAEKPIDWIMLNTSEILDRFQEIDYLPRSLLGALTQRREVESPPAHIVWSYLLDESLRGGLRELAKTKQPRVRAGGLVVRCLTIPKGRLVLPAGADGLPLKD